MIEAKKEERTIICPHCDDEIDCVIRESGIKRYDKLLPNGNVEQDTYGSTYSKEDVNLLCPNCYEPIEDSITDKLFE